MLDTSPPKRAMSRMYLDAMAELADADGRNRVCTPETFRLIWAWEISLSKSMVDRRPLMMKSAPISAATSTTSLAKLSTSMFGEVAERLLDHLLPLGEGEQRLALLRVAHRRHDHLVEEVGRGLDQLDVSVVDRVERSRDTAPWSSASRYRWGLSATTTRHRQTTMRWAMTTWVRP